MYLNIGQKNDNSKTNLNKRYESILKNSLIPILWFLQRKENVIKLKIKTDIVIISRVSVLKFENNETGTFLEIFPCKSCLMISFSTVSRSRLSESFSEDSNWFFVFIDFFCLL